MPGVELAGLIASVGGIGLLYSPRQKPRREAVGKYGNSAQDEIW